MASFLIAMYSGRDQAEGFADLFRNFGVRVAVVPEGEPRGEGELAWGCRVRSDEAGAVERIRRVVRGREPLSAP